MPTKKTKLNHSQVLRLINLVDLDHGVIEVYFIEVATSINKIQVHYSDHDQDLFLPDDEIDIIMNGIQVERNAE